eukprot:gene1227-11317_t
MNQQSQQTNNYSSIGEIEIQKLTYCWNSIEKNSQFVFNQANQVDTKLSIIDGRIKNKEKEIKLIEEEMKKLPRVKQCVNDINTRVKVLINELEYLETSMSRIKENNSNIQQ